MGQRQTKEQPKQTGPLPLLGNPWRSHISWTYNEREQLLKDIYEYHVKGEIEYLNCLLLGQAAAGKTSFFNTCATALKDEGRILSPLTVLKSTSSSVTTKFETHPLYTKNDKIVRLRIFDCRGLHDIQGVTAGDIRLIMDGHIKHGYQINPVSSIAKSDKCYRKKPELGDRMHCVVYVINAENPSAALAGESAEKIFKETSTRVGKWHVPQIVIMTKVDRLRLSINENLPDLFRSGEVQKKLSSISSFMSLPDFDILPMSNYHNEPVPNTNKDILTLTNLKTIMDRANDFVQKVSAGSTPSNFFD